MEIGVRLRRWTSMNRQSYARVLNRTIRVNPLVASAVVSLFQAGTNNPVIVIACPEADRGRIGEGSSPTINRTCPNQARKVARLQADNSPASQINRPAVDAIAMLLMTIHPIWGAKTAG